MGYSMEALGNRVVLLPKELKVNEHGEEVNEAGFVVKSVAQVRDYRDQTSEGVIVDIGPSAWLDPALGGEPWCEIGDRVIYAKYSGKFVIDPEDKKEYVVVNDDAIQVRIEKCQKESL